MARTRKNKPLISLVFGDALKDARVTSGLSHEELGRRIGKTDSIISGYETGFRFPPKTTFDAIEKEIKRELRPALRAKWEEGRKEWENRETGGKGKRSLGELELVTNYRKMDEEARDLLLQYSRRPDEMPTLEDMEVRLRQGGDLKRMAGVVEIEETRLKHVEEVERDTKRERLRRRKR